MRANNNDVDKSLKGLPNRKSKGKFVTSIWVERDFWEDFKAWNKERGLTMCSSVVAHIKIAQAILRALESLNFSDLLSENERSDRIERKRQIFTYTLFTQTPKRDKRREKNLLGMSMGVSMKPSKRFYCALRDVWVEFGDLPLSDCRGCPNGACGAYVFSRAA
jgi:hypothetical protein